MYGSWIAFTNERNSNVFEKTEENKRSYHLRKADALVDMDFKLAS